MELNEAIERLNKAGLIVEGSMSLEDKIANAKKFNAPMPTGRLIVPVEDWFEETGLEVWSYEVNHDYSPDNPRDHGETEEQDGWITFSFSYDTFAAWQAHFSLRHGKGKTFELEMYGFVRKDERKEKVEKIISTPEECLAEVKKFVAKLAGSADPTEFNPRLKDFHNIINAFKNAGFDVKKGEYKGRYWLTRKDGEEFLMSYNMNGYSECQNSIYYNPPEGQRPQVGFWYWSTDYREENKYASKEEMIQDEVKTVSEYQPEEE